MIKSRCNDCRENPIYANVPTCSLFQEYIPTCPLGYDDCINDPAYLYTYYNDFYHYLYAFLTPEQASAECCQKRIENDPDEGDYCCDYEYENK